MRVLAVILVLAGVAHAGEPSAEQQLAAAAKVQALMKEADDLYRAARDRGDLAAADLCGEKYLEVAALMPAAGGDPIESQYNASVCFAQGGSAERALALVDELVRTAPTHKLVFHARMRGAMLRRAMGDWRRAADELNDLANRYAGEREAYDAQWEAIVLYDALGERALMQRAAETWIKKFGLKDRARAAELALHLAMPRDDDRKPADKIRALQQWLKTYGGKDRALTARAYLALGEAELAASCPVKVDARGLCLAAPWTPHPPLPPMTYPAPKLVAVPKRKVLAHCAPDAIAVKVKARDPRGVARATAALKHAIHAGEAAREYGHGAWNAARARLALATVPVEEALALTLPTLRFGAIAGVPDPVSRKALASWFEAWNRALTRAHDALAGDAPPGRAPGVELVAIGRASWLILTAVETLQAAPMPPRPPGLDDDTAVAWRDAYCGALSAAVEPYRERAFQAASFCLARANQQGLVEDAGECLAVYERLQGTTRERLPGRAAPPSVRDLAPPVLRDPRAPTPPRP